MHLFANQWLPRNFASNFSDNIVPHTELYSPLEQVFQRGEALEFKEKIGRSLNAPFYNKTRSSSSVPVLVNTIFQTCNCFAKETKTSGEIEGYILTNGPHASNSLSCKKSKKAGAEFINMCSLKVLRQYNPIPSEIFHCFGC